MRFLSDRTLRRKQRNEIFELVAKQGFIVSANYFTFHTVVSSPGRLNRSGAYLSTDEDFPYYRISRLVYLDSDIGHECWFEFHYYTRINEYYWGVRYVPHETAGSPWTEIQLSWRQVKTHFNSWLLRVTQDFVLPDFWSVPEFYRFAVNFENPETDSAPFNKNEVKLLRQGLARTEEEIGRSFDLSSKDRAYVHAKFDELSLKLDRLSRFDWRGLFISTVTSLAIELAFDSDKRKLLMKVIQAVFTGGHLLPP